LVRVKLTYMALAFALWGAEANAYCRQALLLALDVSSSVDSEEYALQRDGLAQALLSPGVKAALFTAPGDVALAVYEWSGRYQQAVVMDWVLLRDEATLRQAVARMLRRPRSHNQFPTAIGYALGFGAGLLRDAPRCDRDTLDMSGDGISNDGFSPALAYGAFEFGDTVVNGLVIGDAPDVLRYYGNEVIRSAGAFVETARDYTDYEAAMTRKLIREISVGVIGAAPRTRQSGSGGG
jgi:Protein of unknown function (DUF1194)